jgi:cyclase
MQRVLITGVAGFIGSHVAEHCLEMGFNVTGVDDLSGGFIENVPKGVDFRRSLLGKPTAYVYSGTSNTGLNVVELAKRAENLGVGEVLLNSIDRDGTMTGYDLSAIKETSAAISIPLIACGGGGSLLDFRASIHEAGASAATAGAFFVFVGRRRAVPITYPSQQELESSVFQ